MKKIGCSGTCFQGREECTCQPQTVWLNKEVKQSLFEFFIKWLLVGGAVYFMSSFIYYVLTGETI
jgi:hypothetical protein